jgi:hypothetical protein
MTDKTRSQEIAADVAALFRARNPLIWIVTGKGDGHEGQGTEASIGGAWQRRR